jgi:hypothetical protein
VNAAGRPVNGGKAAAVLAAENSISGQVLGGQPAKQHTMTLSEASPQSDKAKPESRCVANLH